MTKFELLMLRCDFLQLSDGMKLTAKGRRYLPASVWRAWNSLLCEISPAHRRRVITMLEYIDERTKNGGKVRLGIPFAE